MVKRVVQVRGGSEGDNIIVIIRGRGCCLDDSSGDRIDGEGEAIDVGLLCSNADESFRVVLVRVNSVDPVRASGDVGEADFIHGTIVGAVSPGTVPETEGDSRPDGWRAGDAAFEGVEVEACTCAVVD